MQGDTVQGVRYLNDSIAGVQTSLDDIAELMPDLKVGVTNVTHVCVQAEHPDRVYVRLLLPHVS
jgi:hypothetical protein